MDNPEPNTNNAALTSSKTYRDITTLSEWGSNARNINDDAFARLKDQLELKGQYKPLLITPDGTVLGGNMRLKAMRETNMKQVWVQEVDFQQRTSDALWFAIIDGKEQKETYLKKEDGMMAYSLSDNDRAGYYDSDLMANIMPQFNIDWNEYAVDFEAPETIKEMIDAVAPGSTNENEGDGQQAEELVVRCPGCNNEFDAYKHKIDEQ